MLVTIPKMQGQKRNAVGDGGDGQKRMRGGNPGESLRFVVNSKKAGGIIGKGGQTIKRLREQYNATVTVPDSESSERVLTITASKEDCLQVLKECLEYMEETPYSQFRMGEGQSSAACEVNLLLQQSQVGGIIGSGGSRIKELRSETNATIKVFQDCLINSTERVVAIAGDPEVIINTVEKIFGYLEDAPLKGNVRLYDPASGGGGGFMERGDFGGGRGGRGMGRGGRGGRGGPRGGGGNFGGPNGDYGGFDGPRDSGFGGPRGGGYGGPHRDGGFGGGRDHGDRFGGGNFTRDNFAPPSGNVQYPPPMGNNQFGGNQQQTPPGGAGFDVKPHNQSGPGSLLDVNSQQVTSTQVTIPSDLAGAIIGKGGERIRATRQQCGADIRIDEAKAGDSDRLITITGNQDQIQHAQFLMQQRVKDYSGKQ